MSASSLRRNWAEAQIHFHLLNMLKLIYNKKIV